MNTRARNIALSMMAAVAAVTMTGCATAAQPGVVGVVVDDYFIIPTDKDILGCIQPETSQTNFVNQVYFYPARQISWEATEDADAERKPYVVVSNREAPAELKVPVTVTMDLTTDCELLKDFHRQLGTKYSGWINDDGTTTDGWINTLDYAVGKVTEVTLTRIAQKYTWQKIWNDDVVRLEFEKTLQDELPSKVKERTDDKEFFTDFQVTVGKPDPIDPNLKAAIAAGEAKIQEANAERVAADAQVATAQSETKVATEKAKQRRAEIEGYPTVEDYLKAEAIKNGISPWATTTGTGTVNTK